MVSLPLVICGPGSKGSEGSVGKVDGAFGPEGSKGSKVSRSLRLQGLWWRMRRNYSLRYVPSPRPCGHTERSEESGTCR